MEMIMDLTMKLEKIIIPHIIRDSSTISILNAIEDLMIPKKSKFGFNFEDCKDYQDTLWV
jgi:hypothetical protein